ncbi:ATP-binding protein [Burkholderia ubonensis]|uniref:Chromosome segregation protein SMC n=1 Tax=Burkholderia ubonensis TaxID=101571 RepID=A0AB74CXZ2_9BURK|nr:YhaN family protein [Burkholderia ubonensis]PAJ78394.1 chromosome segregation protein SMC [Burkholderia ubonensis]PAJ85037.1 chromosome segregation protein SMC [Burkholderia ubonensis]PAJ91947.1 chromosome segregation protein SMC [Burkholderia ubonensis]PAJ98906.1 chromosome segregation protein SMC [Burkholderia ubonensis]PAK05120.1 chromosome segregation protein SMC [Burkholderia ubonensis]
MRIKRLDLIKYGKFTDAALGFPRADHDFHVIVGPNEAGKSTIRTAVSELLFGMKLQTPLDFLHSTPELRIGGVLEGAAGEMAFHRARGRTPLRTPADERLPDDYLAAVLDGASKEFFEQMFGLDHARLVEGGRSILDASDKLGQVLFESAAGVGSLGPVREELEARSGELWAPRRSGSAFAVAETSFNEAVGELKAVQVRTRDWVDRKEAREAVDQEIERARAEQRRLESLRSKLERVRRLAPYLKELTVKEAALVELGPVVELPPTAQADLLKAQGDLAAERKVLEERRTDLAGKRLARDAIVADGDALALSADIDALDRLRSACANHPQDLLLRDAEVERHLLAAFGAAAQLGWPADEAALRAALPKALSLKTVTNLLREHGALHQALIGARESLDEKVRELAQLKDQLDRLSTVEAPEALRIALADAQGFRNSASREQALEREVALAERALTDALDGLGQWRKPVAALRTLDLPSTARLVAWQKDDNEHAGAVAAARDALDHAREELERLELQEKHFAENHKVITTADVLAARARRDGAWGDIKRGAVGLDAGAPAVDDAIRLADELVDSRLGTTQAAATLQSLRQQVESARTSVTRRQAALGERERELSAHWDAWTRLATAAGVPGMPLADMNDWLAKREMVFAAQAEYERQAHELESTRAARLAAQAALQSALRAVSRGSGDGLAALVAAAESFVQSAEKSIAQQGSLEDQARQVERARAGAQAKADHAQVAYDAWQAQWRDALADARLTTSAVTLAAAEGAVELANAVSAELAAADAPRSRIAAIRADLAALERDARRLAEVLDPELLAAGNWPEVARRLTARLAAATETAKAIERADDAIRHAEGKVADAVAAVAGADARIQPLLEMAGVEAIDAALPLAERSDRHRQLRQSVDAAQEALVRDGDGLSQEAIEAEIAEQDLADVPALLESAKQALGDVGKRLNELAQKQVVAEQAFGAIDGQANAAVAEAKRQEALAAMGDAAEQYLEAATASRLLKWATDRYRDQKQGPMLKRAGEIFAGLTLGEFARLTVDTERTPPALHAKRTKGTAVEVTGMSEGTRDQLFLALRIAALELQLRNRTALPFVADDLFINFDDARAKAGLEALRDLSTRTQVLFLTHHDHLLPLVKAVFGERVNVVALQREPVGA